MTDATLGWDVGGANVKAARVDGRGPAVAAVAERAFPLWREPAQLPEVLSAVARDLGIPRRLGVTMTAELADCFATKREGVGFVLDAFSRALPGIEAHVYGVDGCFHSPEQARRRPLRVAAANWRASAAIVAESFPDAVFVDVGSTTTDIIPIVEGRIAARGRTDPGRLRSGELVYTGALRTPVCATVRSLPWRGRRCRVAAELFAIAADAHRWLGRLEEQDYTCETPDGRGRSRAEAGARLARMVCADSEMLAEADLTAIATQVAAAQVGQIAAALGQVLRRLAPRRPTLAVLAGQGAFLGEAAARRAALAPYHLESRLGRAAARATPAAAVALLLARSAAT